MTGEEQQRPRALFFAAVGVVLAIGAFWLVRMLYSGKSVDLLTSDLFLYYLPAYETLYGALRAGVLPTWNPYQLCGIPGLASLQAGFFYPGHLLYLVLPVWPAFAISSIAHLALLAISMMVLVRRLGLALPAAIAAALVLAVRGRYPQMVVFPNMVEAAAWLPVGALLVLSLARGASTRAEALRPVALLAIVLGMSLLAGYPQLTVYVVYSWGALLAIFLLRERANASRWIHATVFFAFALALGVGLAQVQLLPGFELTQQGTRSPGSLTRWEQFPFGWYGPDVVSAFVDTVRAPFPELPLSLGAVALVLLPLALLARGQRILGIGCCLAACIVVLFAMGPITPFFDWIATLPALGWFRFPRRSLFMADFFVALALALAWDVASRFAQRGRGACDAAEPSSRVSILVSSVAAITVVWFAVSSGEEIGLLWAHVVSVGLALSTWLVIVIAARNGSARAPALLVGLFALEIAVAELDRPLAWSGPTSLAAYHMELSVYPALAMQPDRVWLRSLGMQPALPPKLATYFELRSVDDYEPLNLRRQAEYFTYLMEGRLAPERKGRPYSGRLKHLTAPTYPGAIEARGHLLDVAAVRWFLVSQKAAKQGELADYVTARGLAGEDVPDSGLVLLENPHAFPRAYAVYEVAPATPPLELMQRLADPGFDPLAVSFAEGFALARTAGSPERGHAARISRDEPDVVEVEVELEAPGMLVLADSFYPGWHATVAGQEVEIHAVNHLFRGVSLPAGRHSVRFEYVPRMLYAGAVVSLASLLLIALLLRTRRSPVARDAAR